MTFTEQIQARIESKGIRSEDIKHQGHLTVEQIASISPERAYMWITTREWKCKHFKQWLKAIETVKTHSK